MNKGSTMHLSFLSYPLILRLLVFSLQCATYFGHGELFYGSRISTSTVMIAAAPYESGVEPPSALPPSMAPESLIPLLPSSPMYPFLPNGSVPQHSSGLCNLNFSAVAGALNRTAGDCTAPLAEFVGNVICCPQLKSMLYIFQGVSSSTSGSLALNVTEAADCVSDAMTFLTENGANGTIMELCSVELASLTGGVCPITRLDEFEMVVNTSELLYSCSSVDPLKECCKPICQPAIMNAAVLLASRNIKSLPSNSSLGLQQVVDDCQGVVLAWLASQIDTDEANKAFRNLFSCDVNKVCPLAFDDISYVAEACSGSSPSNSTCCSSLYHYISSIQQQMLITNVQALECVTLFGSMLKRKGVTDNIYELCDVDLKDFSLQVHGEQGCLLRAIPTDVVYDRSSGISFICDLNDNIAAPWPLSSSLSSFPLCARSFSLPALPVAKTSDCAGTSSAMLVILFMAIFCFLFCI